MADLLSGFNEITEAEWKARLEKDLKGITFEQLKKKDASQLEVNPFYTQVADSNSNLFCHNDWAITHKLLVFNEVKDNKALLYALSSGASAIHLVVTNEEVNWSVLLNGIDLSIIDSFFEISKESAKKSLKQYLSDQGNESASMIIGADQLFDAINANKAVDAAIDDHTIWVDNSVYFEAGTNSVTQLSLAVASVNEALQLLTDVSVVKTVVVKVATSTLFFEEISKLRALRQLLALLFDTYKISPTVKILASSGMLQKASYDVYSNLLRDTLSGLGAVLGGADSLSISAFDAQEEEKAPSFTHRMSINQQLLMKEESYLSKVADVSAGSFFISQRTEDMAKAAWLEFQHVEATGGIVAFTAQGNLMEMVNSQAQALINDYNEGKRIWIGVNKYPNALDLPVIEVKAYQPKNCIEPLSLVDYIKH